MTSKLNVMSLTMVTAGVYLIWCGFTDRSPLEVLKTIMQGDYKHLPESGSWSSGKLVIGGGTFPPLPGSTNPPAPTPKGNSGPPDVMV
jgi:hypothetical protein